MITELNRQEFHKIEHITDTCKNIEVRAVVNGINPGRLLVDHPTEPTTALIWIQGQQGFQLVGDTQSKVFLESLEGYMRTHIEPELKKRDIHCVEIGVEGDAWDNTIQSIFQHRKISSDVQHVFSLRENEESADIQDPDHGITIRRLDVHSLKSGQLGNLSFLESKISRFWDSMDSFFQYGFGFFAEKNDQAVSVCFSGFVADRIHAIDIETLEGYRRSNYGTAVANAFVQECLQQGIHPYWDCTPDNTGSIRIARAVGLTPDFDYRIFWYGI
ncbi:GNAT family N-acetyltransferase [Paenibacillus sp. JCM 10914]|uniref:GNAT family N-acetyltransferase n=1 Tax=Paenibacillus sp. JCM 10914 TaxID=1236974 RepID=UPI0003CC7103|nr:GNAT family N-acetyltransferase [Paenibacillus sp. JCM 10914]GAE05191.1 acetyltransferase, GNAT family, putative [Paenibacillus sp. JCM 10914]